MTATMTDVQLPNPLYLGNAVTVGVTFTNPQAGVPRDQWEPVDPSTVTLTYIPGTGTEPVELTFDPDSGRIEQLGVGVYICEVNDGRDGEVPGRWEVKWTGTGACAAIWVRSFPVEPLPF